jgi:hypothetical protein
MCPGSSCAGRVRRSATAVHTCVRDSNADSAAICSTACNYVATLRQDRMSSLVLKRPGLERSHLQQCWDSLTYA